MNRVILTSKAMISYGTLICIAGLGMIASIIFVAPGAVALILGLALLILGMVLRASAVAIHYAKISSRRTEESAQSESAASGAALS